MVNLNTVGTVVAVLAAAYWGFTYWQEGATAFSNIVLLFGGAFAATCYSLAWADSYTS